MDRLLSSAVIFIKRFIFVVDPANDKYPIDFEWAFGLNRIALSLIGIWPEETRKKQSFKYLRIPIMAIWLLLVLFFPQMYALTKIYMELPLVVDNLTTSSTTLTTTIKLILLYKNRQVLEPAIKAAMTDWSLERSNWELTIMSKQAQRARLFTLSGCCLTFTCVIGFVFLPYFNFSIRIINNITDPIVGHALPLQTVYPYPYTVSPYYELTTVLQMVAGCFTGVGFCVVDNFFGALVFHACAQCEILGIKMREILPLRSCEGVAAEWTKCGQSFLLAKLRQCVRKHTDLIRFIDAVEKSFSLLILVQVLCLSVIMCCLGFGVIKTVQSETDQISIIQIITLVGTLMNLLIHMLVYCIASEILANHSCGFCDSIYYSNWYLLPNAYAKDIMLIMTISKTPLRLSAGKFFYLSLRAYLNILKTSAGYISMLLTVSK